MRLLITFETLTAFAFAGHIPPIVFIICGDHQLTATLHGLSYPNPYALAHIIILRRISTIPSTFLTRLLDLRRAGRTSPLQLPRLDANSYPILVHIDTPDALQMSAWRIDNEDILLLSLDDTNLLLWSLTRWNFRRVLTLCGEDALVGEDCAKARESIAWAEPTWQHRKKTGASVLASSFSFLSAVLSVPRGLATLSAAPARR